MYESTRRYNKEKTPRLQHARSETMSQVRTPTFIPVPLMNMMGGSAFPMGYANSHANPFSVDAISGNSFDFTGKLSPVYVISQVRGSSHDLSHSRVAYDYADDTMADFRKGSRASFDDSDTSDGFSGKQMRGHSRHDYTKMRKSRSTDGNRSQRASWGYEATDIRPVQNRGANQHSAPLASSSSSSDEGNANWKQKKWRETSIIFACGTSLSQGIQ